MKAVSMAVALVVVVVMVTGPLGGGGVAEAVSCEPDCTGKDFGDKVINPKNCSEFYYCLGDGTATDHSTPCPPGNIFNEGDVDCSAGDPSLCESPCLGSSGCHLTCNGTLDFVSDINNCSLYYTCTPSGVIGPYSCKKEHPYFNGESCGNDKSTCCESICAPYCDASSDVFLIPDPLDCKRYYFCTEEGTPGEEVHFTCDGNFNVQAGQCSSTANCTLLCKDGTTTTQGTGGGGSSSTSTSPSDCANSLTCTSVGFFPVCHSCQPQYFSCETVGEQATIGRCTGSLVFNPDPEYPMCILPANCPYHP